MFMRLSRVALGPCRNGTVEIISVAGTGNERSIGLNLPVLCWIRCPRTGVCCDFGSKYCDEGFHISIPEHHMGRFKRQAIALLSVFFFVVGGGRGGGAVSVAPDYCRTLTEDERNQDLTSLS